MRRGFEPWRLTAAPRTEGSPRSVAVAPGWHQRGEWLDADWSQPGGCLPSSRPSCGLPASAGSWVSSELPRGLCICPVHLEGRLSSLRAQIGSRRGRLGTAPPCRLAAFPSARGTGVTFRCLASRGDKRTVGSLKGGRPGRWHHPPCAAPLSSDCWHRDSTVPPPKQASALLPPTVPELRVGHSPPLLHPGAGCWRTWGAHLFQRPRTRV